MNHRQREIIDNVTPLFVYTLEFTENAQDERFTVERLETDYERLIQEAKSTAVLGEEHFETALFPVVAWIDEMILSSHSPISKVWRRALLQKRHFDTSNAGAEFYERLETLDENETELRFLYIYCISLGFKGMYYRPEDTERLREIYETQKAYLKESIPQEFPDYAFKKAYAQGRLPLKGDFKTSYYGVGVIIFLSLSAALITLLAAQLYLNTLLERYDIF